MKHGIEISQWADVPPAPMLAYHWQLIEQLQQHLKPEELSFYVKLADRRRIKHAGFELRSNKLHTHWLGLNIGGHVDIAHSMADTFLSIGKLQLGYVYLDAASPLPDWLQKADALAVGSQFTLSRISDQLGQVPNHIVLPLPPLAITENSGGLQFDSLEADVLLIKTSWKKAELEAALSAFQASTYAECRLLITGNLACTDKELDEITVRLNLTDQLSFRSQLLANDYFSFIASAQAVIIDSLSDLAAAWATAALERGKAFCIRQTTGAAAEIAKTYGLKIQQSTDWNDCFSTLTNVSPYEESAIKNTWASYLETLLFYCKHLSQ